MSLIGMCQLAQGEDCITCHYLRDFFCPGQWLAMADATTCEHWRTYQGGVVDTHKLHTNEVDVGALNGAVVVVRLNDKASKTASHKAGTHKDMRIREDTKRMVHDSALVLKDTNSNGTPAYVRVRPRYVGGHHSK